MLTMDIPCVCRKAIRSGMGASGGVLVVSR